MSKQFPSGSLLISRNTFYANVAFVFKFDNFYFKSGETFYLVSHSSRNEEYDFSSMNFTDKHFYHIKVLHNGKLYTLRVKEDDFDIFACERLTK